MEDSNEKHGDFVGPSQPLAGSLFGECRPASRPGIRHRDSSLRENTSPYDQDRDTEDIRILQLSVSDDVYHIDLPRAEDSAERPFGLAAERAVSLRIERRVNVTTRDGEAASHGSPVRPVHVAEPEPVICGRQPVVLY